MVYTSAKTYQEIAKELTAVTKSSSEEYYDYGVFVDGMEYSEWMTANGYTEDDAIIADTSTLEGFNTVISTKNTGHFLPSNSGVLTQVFVIEPVEYFTTQGTLKTEKGKVYVTCINTYLAEVRGTIDYGNGEYGTTVRYYTDSLNDSNGEEEGLNVDASFDREVITTEEYAKGDIVMVQISAKDAVADENGNWSSGSTEIITINKPETVQGDVTSVNISSEYVGGMWVKIDDVSYDFSVGMRGNLSDMSEDLAPSTKDTIIAYFDNNTLENGEGYILGYQVVESAPKYMYVEECNIASWNFYGVTARVTFADGTEEIITVTTIDGDAVDGSNVDTIPESSRFKTEDGITISANENFKVDASGNVDTGTLENRIFGYEEIVAADGSVTYNLVTTIQDNYDAEKGASQGGLLEMVDGQGLPNYAGKGTLNFTGDEDNLTENGTPVKDTMAVFSSVYLPGNGEYSRWYEEYELTENENEDGYDIDKDENARKYTDFDYDMVVANPNNKIYAAGLSTDLYYNFALYSKDVASFVMTSSATGEYTTPAEEVYGHSIDANGMDYDGTNDHLFMLDENTVFVDVVNNNSWVGIYDSNFEKVTNGLLNMQVVFGEGGYADTVFINYGIEDALEAGDYVIFQSSKAFEDTHPDGYTTWTYDVWKNGVSTTITSKTKQLQITNEKFKDYEVGSPLQTNTLYKISEYNANDGYVVSVEYEYDYSNLFTAQYNDEERKTNWSTVTSTADTTGFHKIYNNLWSVANNVGTSSFTLQYDDSYADGKGAENGIADSDDYIGADKFQYTSSTVFMVIEVDTTGKLRDVYAGDASDINSYSASRPEDPDISWVDVVKVSSNNSGHTPIAELVVVVNPYTKAAVNSGEDLDLETGDVNVTYDQTSASFGNGTTSTSPVGVIATYYSEVRPDSDSLIADTLAAILNKNFGGSATVRVVSDFNGTILWEITKDDRDPMYFSFEYEDTTETYVIQDEAYQTLSAQKMVMLGSGDANGIVTPAGLGFLSMNSTSETEAVVYAALEATVTENGKSYTDLRGTTTVEDAIALGVTVFTDASDVGSMVRLETATGFEMKTGAEFLAMEMNDLLASYTASIPGEVAAAATMKYVDFETGLVSMDVDVSELEFYFPELYTVEVSDGESITSDTTDTGTDAWFEQDGDIYTFYGSESDVDANNFIVTVTLTEAGLLVGTETEAATFTFENADEVRASSTMVDGSASLVSGVITFGTGAQNGANETAVAEYLAGSTATFTINAPVVETINVMLTSDLTSYDALKDEGVEVEIGINTTVGTLFSKLKTIAGFEAIESFVVNDTLYVDGVSDMDVSAIGTFGFVEEACVVIADGVLVKLPIGVSGAEDPKKIWAEIGDGASADGNYVYGLASGTETVELTYAESGAAKMANGIILSTEEVGAAGTAFSKTSSSATGGTLTMADALDGAEFGFAYYLDLTGDENPVAYVSKDGSTAPTQGSTGDSDLNQYVAGSGTAVTGTDLVRVGATVYICSATEGGISTQTVKDLDGRSYTFSSEFVGVASGGGNGAFAYAVLTVPTVTSTSTGGTGGNKQIVIDFSA